MSEKYNEEIKCPYCGYEFGDSWEYNNDDGREIECLGCDKKFILNVNFDVSYSTDRIDCEESHDFNVPSFSDISQSTCDNWNKRNFCGRKDWKPHRTWTRKCRNCEFCEYKEVEVGAEDPWKQSE